MKTIICFLLIIDLLHSIPSLGSTTKKFNSDEFYFTIELPTNWEIKEGKDSTSFLRLLAFSADGGEGVAVYAAKGKGQLFLDEFTDIDLNISGKILDVSEVDISNNKAIKKVFFKREDSLYQNVYYTVYGNFGYILRVISKTENSLPLNSIVESFKILPPVSFRELAKQIGLAIMALLLYAVILSSLLVIAPIKLGKLAYATKDHWAGDLLCVLIPFFVGVVFSVLTYIHLGGFYLAPTLLVYLLTQIFYSYAMFCGQSGEFVYILAFFSDPDGGGSEYFPNDTSK